MSSHELYESEHGTDSSIDLREKIMTTLPTSIPLLLNDLDISPSDIAYLGVGISNVVFGFTNISSPLKWLECVIRVQVFPANASTKEDMMCQAAVLRVLSRHLETIPRFLHMDYSENNRLGHPYMITSRIRGVCLNDVCDSLTFEEEIQIGRAIANEILSFGKIIFPGTGPLIYNHDDNEQLSIGSFLAGGKQLPLPSNRSMSLKDWLLVLLEWRCTIASAGKYEVDCCQRLKAIVLEMDQMQYFVKSDTLDNSILSHSDLHYGNIMAEKTSTSEWHITGLLDWDEACAMPSVLAHRSLEWIWTHRIYEDEDFALRWTGDLDFVPNSKFAALPSDRQYIKTQLDDYLAARDPTYMDEVYGRGRWIRRVAKFAIFGWSDAREFKMSEWLLEEWRSMSDPTQVEKPSLSQ